MVIFHVRCDHWCLYRDTHYQEWRETKDLSNRCKNDKRKCSLLKRTWWLVSSMEHIPSKLGHDWWNETLTRGMNLKKHSLLYYSPLGSDLRSVVYVSLLLACENIRFSSLLFWSLGPLSKTCLLQKRLPLSAVRAMVILHVRCDRWSVLLWLCKLREQYF